MALLVFDPHPDEITALEQELHVRIGRDAIIEADRLDRPELLPVACQRARDELWQMIDPDLLAKWNRFGDLERNRQNAVVRLTAAKKDGRTPEATSLRSWLEATNGEYFALKFEIDPQIKRFEEGISQLWPTVTAQHIREAARDDEIVVTAQL
jgi:hypothetical protein